MKITAVLCLVACLVASALAFGGMPGGLVPYPVKEVQKHLPLIEKHYNEQTGDENYGVVAKIESAQTQVRCSCAFNLGFQSETDDDLFLPGGRRSAFGDQVHSERYRLQETGGSDRSESIERLQPNEGKFFEK